MHIYRISNNTRSYYLTHNIDMLDDGFENLCNDILSDEEDKNLDYLKHFLITRVGFRLLSVKGSFEL